MKSVFRSGGAAQDAHGSGTQAWGRAGERKTDWAKPLAPHPWPKAGWDEAPQATTSASMARNLSIWALNGLGCLWNQGVACNVANPPLLLVERTRIHAKADTIRETRKPRLQLAACGVLRDVGKLVGYRWLTNLAPYPRGNLRTGQPLNYREAV